MLLRVSVPARDPPRVADGLARLLDARTLLAPTPPFPPGVWFVCLDDGAGTIVEVVPWGFVLDPDRPHAWGRDSLMREHSCSHVMLQTPLSRWQIERAAERAGWEYTHEDAGLYQFCRVWVEGAHSVELMTRRQAADYRAVFGAEGADALETKLQALEVAYALASDEQKP